MRETIFFVVVFFIQKEYGSSCDVRSNLVLSPFVIHCLKEGQEFCSLLLQGYWHDYNVKARFWLKENYYQNIRKLSIVIGKCLCEDSNVALSLYSIQFSSSKLTGKTLD